MKNSNNICIKLFQNPVLTLQVMKSSTHLPASIDLKSQLNGRETERLQQVTQASRWTHGFHPHGARSGTLITLLIRSQRTSSTNSAKRGPVGTSAYRELLEGRSYPRPAFGPPGLTDSRPATNHQTSQFALTQWSPNQQPDQPVCINSMVT